MTTWMLLAGVAWGMCMPGPDIEVLGGEARHHGQEPLVLVAHETAGDTRLEELARDGALVELVHSRTDQRIAMKPLAQVDSVGTWAPAEPVPNGRWLVQLDGKRVFDKFNHALIWVVDDEVERSTRAPRWTGAPKVGSTVIEQYGCGPDVTLPVSLDVRDALWLEATLTYPDVDYDDDEDDEVSAYIYAVGSAQKWIDLGRGMCGGGLGAWPGQTGSLSLVAIGARGQRAPAPGGPFKVEPPAEP